MHDPLSRKETEDFYSYLKEIWRVERLTIPSKNYDTVLDITLNEYDRIQWPYYYACHNTRYLFWLDGYEPTYITSELDGVESPWQALHRRIRLYRSQVPMQNHSKSIIIIIIIIKVGRSGILPV